MKLMVAILATTVAVNAHAARWYLVNGKVMKPGAAKVAKMHDPKTQVLEIESREVEISETSGNFKKAKDLTPKETAKAVAEIKE